MTCPLQSGDVDILLDYCSRSLDVDRADLFEEHLRGCGECREMVRSQMAIWSALDSFETQPVSNDFDRKLHARIAELDRVSPPLARLWAPVQAFFEWPPAWKPALSVGLATAAVATIFVIRGGLLQPEVPVPTIDAVEVERAVQALEDMEMLRQLEATLPGSADTEQPKEEVL